MTNHEQLLELEKKIKSLRREQDHLAVTQTFDNGDWKTKKAEKRYNQIDHQIETKLDPEYDRLYVLVFESEKL